MKFLDRILARILPDPKIISDAKQPQQLTWRDQVHLDRLCRGTMPNSYHLRGRAYRYHPKQHVHEGKEFWRVFEDGDWKWKSQGRFVPRGWSTGHYFALTREVAAQELAHYTEDTTHSKHLLLTIEGSVDNILDMTKWGGLRQMVDRAGYRGHPIDLIRGLVDPQTGGNELTDDIGFVARQMGYNGVLFFSSRVAAQLGETFHKSSERYFDADMFLYEMDLSWRLATNVCFVVFSGAVMLRSIERYSWRGIQWEPNVFHGMSDEELDKHFKFGEEYQNDRLRTFYTFDDSNGGPPS